MKSSGIYLLTGVLAVAACSDEPFALRVGSIGYSAQELAAIPSSSLPALGDLTGWGVAVQQGREDSLIAPLARRARERSRLETLPDVLAAAAAGLSEADLREAYESAPEWELEVRHIIRLADLEAPVSERREALETAEEVLRRARAGEDFGALAAEFSEEPGAAERGGLLQPGREGSWVDSFWSAALALEPGEVSPVVETEYGFHVLRLEDRRPVPFEEADRARLLRRLITASEAAAAMGLWLEDPPTVQIDTPGVAAAREALRKGISSPTVVLARGDDGATYTGSDLAFAWAGTTADERQRLLRDGDVFERWVSSDAREAFWSAEAARLGAPAISGAGTEEMNGWRGMALQWNATFGFAPDISDEMLRAASLRGTVAGGQEFRIARQELEALRPLLRQVYPLVLSGDSVGTASSSEIRNRE